MDKKKFVIVIALIFVIGAIISFSLEVKIDNSVKKSSSDKSVVKEVTTKQEKENIMEGISVNYHASIRIEKDGKVFYFDPYKIEDVKNDADYIFITHSHYDHYSESDIKKVMNDSTKFIVTTDLEDKIKTLNVSDNNITVVIPNEKYKVDDISFNTIPSYNINKTFHKKSYNWVGYVVNIADVKYYIVGDSDSTDELKNVKCDVIFIPVGGTYTMDYMEASNAVNDMDVKYAVPVHYGEAGSRTDAEEFVNNLNDNIEGIILK